MNVGLLTILTALIVACGSGMRTSDEFAAKSERDYTKGLNEIGKRYTRFSSDDSMAQIQKNIEADSSSVPRAIALAQDVLSAKFLSHYRNETNPNKYEVEIKWKNQSSPQLFRGSPDTARNTLAVVLRPVNAGPNINLEVTCFAIGDFTCGKALVLLMEYGRPVGGIEFLRQSKLLQTTGASGILSAKGKTFF